LTKSGISEVCEDCAIANTKENSFNKTCLGSSNIPGERIYNDISFIEERSLVGSKL
jgi:hypothetical protein